MINLINFIAESFRNIIIDLELTDSITFLEAVDVILGNDFTLQDVAQVEEALVFTVGQVLTEDVSLAESIVLLMSWALSEEDSIPLTEAFSIALGVSITDSVPIAEAIDIATDLGFGSGAFGSGSRFGGLKTWTETSPDEALLVENLGFVMGFLIEETTTLTETVAFSDGFGSPSIGDGFGKIPFGR